MGGPIGAHMVQQSAMPIQQQHHQQQHQQPQGYGLHGPVSN
jgi:hypothetical protein